MIVEGVIRDDNTGDIAIDDISVKQGVCTKGNFSLIHNVTVLCVLFINAL
jgi:hypothetical protein